MTQVFISYSRKDLAFVERLAKDLQAAGLQVWYDLSGLEVGQRWGSEIQKAIRKSKIVVAVLSPHSVRSEWVEREILFASNRKLKVVPLLYRSCELPMWCVNLHYIDLQGKGYEAHFPELLKALGAKSDKIDNKKEPVAVLASVQELPDIPKPLEAALEKKEYTPSGLPVLQGPEGEEEPGAAKKTVSPRSLPRRIKIRPVWIIFLLGLLAVIAFSVWGSPQMQARLASSPAPTSTGTPKTIFPIAFTSTSTVAYTPTLTPASTPSDTPTLALPPSPSPTLGIGSQWTSPVDDMVMVYVPAGDFSMGGEHGNLDELPVHSVYLDAYWIDQTEVTKRMYSLCVEKGACLPQNCSTGGQYDGDSGTGNYPLICADWDTAAAYCRWAGRRLPSEAEWEKAARGTDGRFYPWGNAAPTCGLANLFGIGMGENRMCVGHTTAVGSYPDGASPYGALDMAGNAWEWVNDWYSPIYYRQSPEKDPAGPASGDRHVLRGVSWMNSGEFVNRSAYRFGGSLVVNESTITGFRCTGSAP
jgi:formylglycine-generating enzyme required for sulfatase activity